MLEFCKGISLILRDGFCSILVLEMHIWKCCYGYTLLLNGLVPGACARERNGEVSKYGGVCIVISNFF